jgi:hypothetical protein
MTLFSGSGSQEKDSTVGVVAMEEKEETGFMHEQGCGEGQAQANKTSQALAQGVLPAFHRGGLPRLFAHRTLLLVGKDRLIRHPEIGETYTRAIRLGNGLPETLAGPFAAIPDGSGHALFESDDTTPSKSPPAGSCEQHRTTTHPVRALPWTRQEPASRSVEEGSAVFFIHVTTVWRETPKVRCKPRRLLRSW